MTSDTESEATQPAFLTEQIHTVVQRMQKEHYRRHRRRALEDAGSAVLALLSLSLILVRPGVVHTAYLQVPFPIPGTRSQFYRLTAGVLFHSIPMKPHSAIDTWRNHVPEGGGGTQSQRRKS